MNELYISAIFGFVMFLVLIFFMMEIRHEAKKFKVVRKHESHGNAVYQRII
jgi:hypothetical protein